MPTAPVQVKPSFAHADFTWWVVSNSTSEVVRLPSQLPDGEGKRFRQSSHLSVTDGLADAMARLDKLVLIGTCRA